MILGVVLQPNSCPEYLPFNFSVEKMQELVGGHYCIVSLNKDISAYIRTGSLGTLSILSVNPFLISLYLQRHKELLLSLRGTCVLLGRTESCLSDEQLDYINQEYFSFICTSNYERQTATSSTVQDHNQSSH